MASGIGVQRVWPRIVVVAVLIFIGLIAGSAVPSAREYKTVETESLRVTIDSDWVTRAAPGYLPVRFDITNLGDARVIEIVGQGSRMFRGSPRSATTPARPFGQGSTTVSQTLRLARGDRVRFTMAVPIFGDSESFRFELREGNRTLERFNYISVQSRTPVAQASVLFVADSSSPFGTIVPKLMRSMAGRAGGAGGGVSGTPPKPLGGTTFVTPMSGRYPTMDAVLEPDRLPVNWTGYTSVRAVAIGKTEWGQLDEPQKTALMTWVACGGDLILADGQVTDLMPSMPAVAATQPDRTVGRHFFGRVHALSSASIDAAGIMDMLKALDHSASQAWSLPANGAADWEWIETRGFRLPIPGINGVPARAYLSILLLFSVIIGPVSFWFLWRRRQRVLLVLTAPIISIVFIVLLTGYALAGEGFGIHGRAATFTILDEATKQAATRAVASMYAAGMAPSGGLRFGRDVAVFPMGALGTGPRERLAIDLTEAQRYSAGIVQARAPTNIDQITFRAARERLTFTRGPDGLSVVNGLDATLTHLVYRDGEASYRLDAPLAPGGKQTLTPGGGNPATIVPAGLKIGHKFAEIITQQPAGSYLAVLDRSPFWEPGVPELAERGSFHLVLGWPQGQR